MPYVCRPNGKNVEALKVEMRQFNMAPDNHVVFAIFKGVLTTDYSDHDYLRGTSLNFRMFYAERSIDTEDSVLHALSMLEQCRENAKTPDYANATTKAKLEQRHKIIDNLAWMITNDELPEESYLASFYYTADGDIADLYEYHDSLDFEIWTSASSELVRPPIGESLLFRYGELSAIVQKSRATFMQEIKDFRATIEFQNTAWRSTRVKEAKKKLREVRRRWPTTVITSSIAPLECSEIKQSFVVLIATDRMPPSCPDYGVVYQRVGAPGEIIRSVRERLY